jgi:hypothetical protein
MIDRIHNMLAVALDYMGNDGEAMNSLLLLRGMMRKGGLKVEDILKTRDVERVVEREVYVRKDEKRYKITIGPVGAAWYFTIINNIMDTARCNDITAYVNMVGVRSDPDSYAKSEIAIEFAGSETGCKVMKNLVTHLVSELNKRAA